jgi:hypothetical protein
MEEPQPEVGAPAAAAAAAAADVFVREMSVVELWEECEGERMGV